MSEDFSTNVTQAHVQTYDAGLRAFMVGIYNHMSLGVFVTGIVAFAVANLGLAAVLMANPVIAIVLALAPVAVVWFGFNPATMPASRLRTTFYILAVLYGLSFSAIFLVFTGADIARAFFITAAAFAGLSIYGYTTRKSLDGLGTFAVMGVIGALVLGLVNLFVQSSMLMNVVSGISLLAFAGMTAYQTQAMKETYNPLNGEEANARLGWSAALNLYISFVAMFQSILNLMSAFRGE
ncbi:MAG: Bax inhibitor-1/YccA family protein [Pseudomonadota bacterium]